MAKTEKKKKKKIIKDLLDKKFGDLNKVVGGNTIGCCIKDPLPLPQPLCGPQVCTIKHTISCDIC